MRLIHRRNLLPLLAVIVLTSGAWACPKQQSEFDKIAKASNEIAGDVVLSEKIIATQFKAGKISLERKDFFAAKLKLIAVNGKKFNDALIALDAKYPQGSPPVSEIQFLRDNWQLVAGPFLELFGQLDLLGQGTAVKELHDDVMVIERVVNR